MNDKSPISIIIFVLLHLGLVSQTKLMASEEKMKVEDTSKVSETKTKTNSDVDEDVFLLQEKDPEEMLDEESLEVTEDAAEESDELTPDMEEQTDYIKKKQAGIEKPKWWQFWK